MSSVRLSKRAKQRRETLLEVLAEVERRKKTHAWLLPVRTASAVSYEQALTDLAGWLEGEANP